MATKLVPCESKEQALELYDAGMLWMLTEVPDTWQLAHKQVGRKAVAGWYGDALFPVSDWAVLVEGDSA